MAAATAKQMRAMLRSCLLRLRLLQLRLSPLLGLQYRLMLLLFLPPRLCRQQAMRRPPLAQHRYCFLPHQACANGLHGMHEILNTAFAQRVEPFPSAHLPQAKLGPDISAAAAAGGVDRQASVTSPRPKPAREASVASNVQVF